MGYEIKVKDSRIENDTLKQSVEIYADSDSDIPEPLPEWCAGSAVIIMDTQDVKFLSTEGEWV